MYIPPAFLEADLATLHALMERYGFATVISLEQGRPLASHLPLLLDRGRGPCGTLIGHMARANAQWRGFPQEVLVIFHGPHAYVSPAWYKGASGVSTWNYAVVHAYGTPRLVQEREALRGLLERAVAYSEGGREPPWEPKLTEAEWERMLDGIVGFEIPLARIEGKFKLSQNRSAADRSRVAMALGRAADPLEAEVARLMGWNGADADPGPEGG